MANLTGTQLLKVVHLRVLRLTSAGVVAVGTSSRYEHKAPILAAYTPTQPDRERFEQINGAGDQCALYIGPPKAVDSVTMRLDLCPLDAELIEMLAGGSIIAEGTGPGDTVGYLAPTDATVNVNGVAIETWSYQWNGRQRALKGGQPAFYRHFFPKTGWQVGEITKQNGFSTIPLTGTGEVNSAFGTGYTGDPIPVAVGDAAYGWFIDDAVPAGAVGYQAVA